MKSEESAKSADARASDTDGKPPGPGAPGGSGNAGGSPASCLDLDALDAKAAAAQDAEVLDGHDSLWTVIRALIARVRAAERERDDLQRRNDNQKVLVQLAREERDAMCPVVEAAEAWADAPSAEWHGELQDAVAAYRKTKAPNQE